MPSQRCSLCRFRFQKLWCLQARCRRSGGCLLWEYRCPAQDSRRLWRCCSMWHLLDRWVVGGCFLPICWVWNGCSRRGRCGCRWAWNSVAAFPKARFWAKPFPQTSLRAKHSLGSIQSCRSPRWCVLATPCCVPRSQRRLRVQVRR